MAQPQEAENTTVEAGASSIVPPAPIATQIIAADDDVRCASNPFWANS